MQSYRTLGIALTVFALSGALNAHAETPQQILGTYETAARAQAPGFTASATRGAEFYQNRHGQEWSCASCHGVHPTETGKHASTGRSIEPLAVSANPERFVRPSKVERWYNRTCKDVAGRTCTDAEKADLTAYLITVK